MMWIQKTVPHLGKVDGAVNVFEPTSFGRRLIIDFYDDMWDETLLTSLVASSGLCKCSWR